MPVKMEGVKGMEHDLEKTIVPTAEEHGSANEKPPATTYVLYAGFWIRFWAYVIDMIVVGSLHRIVVYPLLRWLDISIVETSMLSTVAISTAVVMYAYFIMMTKFLGQTLGKMVFGLKVIDENKEKLSWDTVIFRELIGKFISKTAFFLGFITIGFSSKKKGWHDYFADTLVIQERKGIPIPFSSLKQQIT